VSCLETLICTPWTFLHTGSKRIPGCPNEQKRIGYRECFADLLEQYIPQPLVDVIPHRRLNVEAVLFQRVHATLQHLQSMFVHQSRTYRHYQHHPTRRQPSQPIIQAREPFSSGFRVGKFLQRHLRPLHGLSVLCRLRHSVAAALKISNCRR